MTVFTTKYLTLASKFLPDYLGNFQPGSQEGTPSYPSFSHFTSANPLCSGGAARLSCDLAEARLLCLLGFRPRLGLQRRRTITLVESAPIKRRDQFARAGQP